MAQIHQVNLETWSKTTAYKVLVEHLKATEGLRLHSYQDMAGTWTIGYGHARGVKRDMSVTLEDAERILAEDIASCYNELTRLDLRLTEWQSIAIVDFIFQYGFSRFRYSTLLDLIRSRRSDNDICKEFRKWVYARSCGKMVVVQGLVKRREWSVKMWKKK